MINLLGILSLIIIEALLVASVVVFFMHKINISDEEILGRDRELGKRMEVIKEKNKIIKEQEKLIEELKNENKQLKRECNRRLQKYN